MPKAKAAKHQKQSNTKLNIESHRVYMVAFLQSYFNHKEYKAKGGTKDKGLAIFYNFIFVLFVKTFVTFVVK